MFYMNEPIVYDSGSEGESVDDSGADPDFDIENEQYCWPSAL